MKNRKTFTKLKKYDIKNQKTFPVMKKQGIKNQKTFSCDGKWWYKECENIT